MKRGRQAGRGIELGQRIERIRQSGGRDGVGFVRVVHRGETGLRVGAPRRAGRVGVDGVAGPLDASHPTAEHLVAHGVGERLRGIGAVDLVAVVVDPDVEVAEVLGPVPPQDRPAGGSEPAADQREGIGVSGWHRWFVGVGRLAAEAVGVAVPELLAQVIELGAQVDPSLGEHADAGIDLVQLHQVFDALGLEPHAVVAERHLDAGSAPERDPSRGPCPPGSEGFAVEDRRGISVGIGLHGGGLRVGPSVRERRLRRRPSWSAASEPGRGSVEQSALGQ